MKKSLFLILALLLILSACGKPAGSETTAPETTMPETTVPETTAPETTAPETTVPPAAAEPTKDEILSAVRAWLGENCSFTIEGNFTQLGMYGFSQTITQTTGQDGSFFFATEFRQWDHTSDYEQIQLGEYFYRTESGSLICYARMDGGQIQRSVLGIGEALSLSQGKLQMVGPEALLPEWGQPCGELGQTESGNLLVKVALPLQTLLRENSFSAAFLSATLNMAWQPFDQETQVTIFCEAEVRPDTMQPVSIRYDLNALKPWVLSDGSISGEFALGTELLYLRYHFDYAMDESVKAPEGWELA